MSNQRGVISILTLILLIIGAALGTPGRFPLIGESEITPQFLYDLILGVVTPLALLIGVLYSVFQAVTARVRLGSFQSSAQAINPSDLGALFRIPEFYLAGVAAFVFVIQVFTKVTLFDEQTQTLIANTIMAVIIALTRSWGDRPPGVTDGPVFIEAVSADEFSDAPVRYRPNSTPDKPGSVN